MAKDPWFKFYPTDWTSDSKLQSCSVGARGLLIEMMCLMHQSERPGYLLVNGVAPDLEQTCTLGRVKVKDYKRYKEELLLNGVLIEEDGVLICQRMVRDQAYRETRRATGKMGGNPVLVHPDLKVDVKVDLKPRSQKSEVREQITTTEEKNMSGLGAEAREVIEYLNNSTGSRFLLKGKSVEQVVTRLKEGFTVEDCKQVIDGQKLDPYFLEHPKYFRPATLFGSKFEGYLSAAPKQRAALERDPKRMIKDMRAESEIRKFIEAGDEPKQVEGNHERQGPGSLCERNVSDGSDPGNG